MKVHGRYLKYFSRVKRATYVTTKAEILHDWNEKESVSLPYFFLPLSFIFQYFYQYIVLDNVLFWLLIRFEIPKIIYLLLVIEEEGLILYYPSAAYFLSTLAI